MRFLIAVLLSIPALAWGQSTTVTWISPPALQADLDSLSASIDQTNNALAGNSARIAGLESDVWDLSRAQHADAAAILALQTDVRTLPALQALLQAAVASIEALEAGEPQIPPPPVEPPPVEPPPVEPLSRVRVGNFYGGSVPAPDSPANLRALYPQIADIALVNDSPGSNAFRRAWGIPIAVWGQTMTHAGGEAFPGSGPILAQGGTATLLTGYESAGSLDNIIAPGVIDAKVASLRSIWSGRQASLPSGLMLDNSSISPISQQEPLGGYRIWSNTPDGVNNGTWNANLALWLNRAAAEVPDSQPMLFNPGHWINPWHSYTRNRDNPDLYAASWINGLDAQLMPALENAPGTWSGLQGLTNLRVLDAIDRPVLYHHQFASADLSNQAAQDWFWGVYAATCEPGSIVAIDLSWDSFGGRDQALARWLQEWSDGGVFDACRDRIEALGDRIGITFPALGSSGTTVTATFEHGSIVLNTRNSAGNVQAEWR